MSWSVPVRETDTVTVTQGIPNKVRNPLQRYTTGPVLGSFNTFIPLGPQPGELWYIESLSILCMTNGNAGNRQVWLYFFDKYGLAVRYLAIDTDKGSLYTFVAGAGSGFSPKTGATDAVTFTGGGPLWASVLEYPCHYAMYMDLTEQASDSLQMSIIARKEIQV